MKIKVKLRAQAGPKFFLRVGIQVPSLPVGDLRDLSHHRQIGLKQGDLLLVGHLPHVPVLIPEKPVPVDLQPADHRVVGNVRVRRGQSGQGVQLLLNMIQIGGGAVIPPSAVPNPEEGSGLPAGFILDQVVVFVDNRRLIHVFQTNVGIQVFGKLIHVVASF